MIIMWEVRNIFQKIKQFYVRYRGADVHMDRIFVKYKKKPSNKPKEVNENTIQD